MTWLPKSVVCLRYYDLSRFRSDLLASSVLALQIFPASIAIAVASGLPPVYGASCAAIATLVASAFGDSKVRIGAPSIVFVAVASAIVTRHGVPGLSLSTFSAAVLLVFFGAIGVGRAIQTLPHPVTLGFFTGIAVLVVANQLPELLGASSQASASEPGWGPLAALRNLTQVKSAALILGLASLVLIVANRRTFRHLPAGAAALAVGALLVRFGHVTVRTVGALYVSNATQFHLYPTLTLRLDLFGSVLSQSLAIAVLVAVESLEAMDLASGHTGEHVDPNRELIVQGGVNIATALTGGLPACGISSYSSENALLGAQTPVAGILESLFLVGFLFVCAPLLPFIPLPVISALILSSVLGMTRWRELSQVVKVGSTEIAAWLAISVLTIVDLTIGVAAGLVVAMFLHIRKQRTVRLSARLYKSSP